MNSWRDAYMQTDANLCQVAAYGSLQQPVTARQAVQSSSGLVKRLAGSHSYEGHSGSVNALEWNAAGSLLISGGDDCRVKIWSTENKKAIHAFDSVWQNTVTNSHGPILAVLLANVSSCLVFVQGHTSSIYAARFMPNTGDEQVVTAAGDRQVSRIKAALIAVALGDLIEN